jgi:hypothetical protein
MVEIHEKQLTAQTPLGRLGQPDDIARRRVPRLERFRLAHWKDRDGVT